MNAASLGYGNDADYDYVVETSVKINDLYLYSDTSHILVEDTVFVVGRYLVEALGGTIEWIGEIKTVKMTLDGHVIEIVRKY